MDGWDFLDTAQRLVNSPHEHDLRTSISRSYYAAFLALRDALMAAGAPLHNKRDVHKDIVDAFISDRSTRDIYKLGERLDSLRTQRNHADYRTATADRAPTTSDAQSACAKAARLRVDLQAVDVAVAVERVQSHRRVRRGGRP